MAMIKILLADDHQLFREGIKLLLMNRPDIEILDEACDGWDVIEKVKTIEPNILLLDMSMPKLSGIEVAKIIAKENKKIKIIMLSANLDEYSLKAALKAGVHAYIHKDVSQEELITAIHAVYNGNEYFSKAVTDTIYKSYIKSVKDNSHDGENASLTERELEITKLFAQGYSYKEIAEKLFITARTVESHKKRIMQKLQIDTTADMVRYAIKNKLIEA
jgi:DNA-binding NarL/FixJ family response regulator